MELPEGQDQFKLNEVCKLANVQPYMLRFWGTEFPQLEASRSGTGQRLYNREQVELILEIRHLLFEEGLTIAGARKRLAGGERSGGNGRKSGSRRRKSVEPKPAVRVVDDDDEVDEQDADEPASAAAGDAAIDNRAPDRVQPLLATVRSVRDEVARIIAELRENDVGT
jgi:DNA-binding transcriptional MerR regulator